MNESIQLTNFQLYCGLYALSDLQDATNDPLKQFILTKLQREFWDALAKDPIVKYCEQIVETYPTAQSYLVELVQFLFVIKEFERAVFVLRYLHLTYDIDELNLKVTIKSQTPIDWNDKNSLVNNIWHLFLNS